MEPTYDPTRNPEVDELGAEFTRLTKDEFAAWLQQPGDIYIIYLPREKSFVIKVPEAQYAFFLTMLQQLQKALGPEVQAIRGTPVAEPKIEIRSES